MKSKPLILFAVLIINACATSPSPSQMAAIDAKNHCANRGGGNEYFDCFQKKHAELSAIYVRNLPQHHAHTQRNEDLADIAAALKNMSDTHGNPPQRPIRCTTNHGTYQSTTYCH